MVRLFAPLMLLLSTAVSGILATPTPAVTPFELAKRDVTTLLAELGQLQASVVTLQTGVSQITSTSSPQDIAVSEHEGSTIISVQRCGAVMLTSILRGFAECQR